MSNTAAIGPYDLIAHARDLIADPEHWTQGIMARTSDGAACDPEDKHAACFCILGALGRARHDLGATYPVRVQAKRILMHQVRATHGASTIAGFNDRDGRKHAEVIELFDKAREAIA